MSNGFDPILETSDSPITVRPGVALVANGRRGAVTFRDSNGPTFGERIFGKYNKYYLVDMAPTATEETFEVQTNQITYKFTITLRYTIQVTNPVEIVNSGMRDLKEFVGAKLRKAAAAAARGFAVDVALQALEAVEAAVEGVAAATRSPGAAGSVAASAVAVDIVTLMLEPDAAAKVMLAAKDQEALDIAARRSKANVDKAQREIEGRITQDDNEIMLQFLATGEDKYRKLLEARVAQGELSFQRLAQLYDKLREDKAIEPFEIQKMFPNIGEQLIDAIGARWRGPDRIGGIAPEKSIEGPSAIDAPAPSDGTETPGVDTTTADRQ